MYYINSEIFNNFVDYFRSVYPFEGCGLLVGTTSPEIIDLFIPIPNVSSNSSLFKFEPNKFIQCIHGFENSNKHWIGVIHSHPMTEAYPSITDVNDWYYNDLSYWIYSLKNKSLKAYTISNKKILQKSYSVTK